MSHDYIAQYLEFNEPTEVPKSFHRWCALSAVSVLLGRNYYFNLGHHLINPNMYVMLIGTPGTRKSSAIKVSKKILTEVGFTKFSAERSTKEKFLLDLQGDTEDADILDKNLFGEDVEAHEIYIAADEFNDFIGNGNMEFISLLGSLWDFTGTYTNRIKNGKSVSISNPTISILGGNTPTGFALAFPAEILGQGFFSRLTLVYGEPTGKRITFPPAPDATKLEELKQLLENMKYSCVGGASISPTAKELLEKIYTTWKPLEDVRFESYSNRRFTHLLKLCLIVSAARISAEITERDVIYANTILTHTEHLMPKALGEFGHSKNSIVAHKILQVLDKAYRPYSIQDIMQQIYTDISSHRDMADVIGLLLSAKKIQVSGTGYLPVKKIIEEKDFDYVDFSLLTPEERSYSK